MACMRSMPSGCSRLGDSPEAIAICDALDTFIEANIDEGWESRVEQAYLDLVATVQAGGGRS